MTMRALMMIVASLFLLDGGGVRAKGVVSEGEAVASRVGASLIGRRVPNVTLELLDGKRVALADLVGHKPIYIKVWATWCKPCREQMPHLEAAYRKYGDRIAVFAVDLGLNDPIDAVRAFQAEHKLTVPIALDRDGSLAERLEVAVTPLHVLIDRAGVIRYVGHEASPELDAALTELARAGSPTSGSPRAEPAAKALSLTLRDGSHFTLAEHAGAPVVVTFVSAWCDDYLAKSRPAMSAACIAHEKKVAALRRARADITWVTVAHPVWTSTEDIDAFVKQYGGTAIGIDDRSAWFRRFGVRDVPTTIVLDRRGAELARVGGNGDALKNALARLK